MLSTSIEWENRSFPTWVPRIQSIRALHVEDSPQVSRRRFSAWRCLAGARPGSRVGEARPAYLLEEVREVKPGHLALRLTWSSIGAARPGSPSTAGYPPKTARPRVIPRLEADPLARSDRVARRADRRGLVPEARHAPYVHDRRCLDRGVYALYRNCETPDADQVVRLARALPPQL